MSQYVYRVICEWEIGQEDVIFADKDDAMEWAEEMLKSFSGLYDNGETFEDYVDEGLVGVEIVRFIN